MSRFGADEETWLRDRYWHPQPDQVVIDIGCFHGSWTLPALEAGAWVYAVDAREEPLNVLRDRAWEFGLSERLFAIPQAIGKPYSAEQIKAIRTGPKPSREMIPDPDVGWSTLDELVEAIRVDRVDWIKIDVEGGELGVLDGARLTLGLANPTVIVEDHSKVYPWVAERNTTQQILDFFHWFGYETDLIESYPDYVIAQRP